MDNRSLDFQHGYAINQITVLNGAGGEISTFTNSDVLHQQRAPSTLRQFSRLKKKIFNNYDPNVTILELDHISLTFR